jgi:hypothetical protein
VAGATVQQYGEVEDYQLGVAASVARLQARTLGNVPANVGLSLSNVSAAAPSQTAAAILTDDAKGFVAAVVAHAVADRSQPVVVTTDQVGAATATDLGGWKLSDRSSTGTYCWDSAGSPDNTGDRLPTAVDSQGRTLTVSPPSGGLPPGFVCRLTYVPRGDTGTAWVTATPSDNETTPLRAREGASAVQLNVTGTVRDASGAEVTLAAEGEKVTLELTPQPGAPADGARIESSPDGGTTWTSAGQSFDCYLSDTGDCESPLRVWGLAAGGYNLKAKIGDTYIAKKDGGVSASDPVQLWFADDPVDNKSYMTASADANQRADYLAPGVASGAWGKQTVEVTLRDVADRAYKDGATRLKAVSPVDGSNGVRYATKDADQKGVFSCKEALDQNGQCASGVYTLVVYAETAGAKQIKVDYTADDPADSFAVKTLPLEPQSARLDYVVVTFVVPPPSAIGSEFILNGVGQSNPEFDPAGVPVDHSVGFSYSPAVRVWDAAQRNLVADASVRFVLSDPAGLTCPATFANGTKTVTVPSGSNPALASFGVAGTSLLSGALGSCVVTAELAEGSVWTPATGSPKTVTWVEDVPVDFANSWFNVSPGDVVADGVATGTVKVRLVDENGYLITSKGGSLIGHGPQGVAITVGAFTYDTVEGVYTAAFRGTKAGAHLITVTYSSTQTLAKQAGANDLAHLVPGPADPARTAGSLVVGGTRQANGVAAVPAYLVVQDAFGNVIAGHAAADCGFQLSPAGTQTVWFGPESSRSNPAVGIGTGTGGTTGADGRCTVEARSFTPGQYMVVGSFGGQNSAGTADEHKAKFSDVTIDAAHSSWGIAKSPVNATASEVIADGLDSWTVIINGRDAAGAVANIQDLRIEWKLGGALMGSAGVTTGVTGTTDPGVAVYQIRTTTSGVYEVSVWVGDDQVATVPLGSVRTQDAQFVAGPAASGTLAASTGPRLYTDTYAQSHSAAVTVSDANGNLVPNTPVHFALDPAKAAHFIGVGDTNPCDSGDASDCKSLTLQTGPSGVAEARVASSASETTTVSTFLGSDVTGPATGSATFLFEDTDLCASCSTFEITPDPASSTRVADGVQSFSGVVTVRTTSNVPAAAGFQVTFDVPDGLVVTGDNRTDSNGRVTVAFTTLVAKKYRVNAQIVGSNIPVADQELTFVPGPAVAARSQLDVSTENVQADGAASNRAWVIVRDANNNPVSGQTVYFTVAEGSTAVEGPTASAATAVTCDFSSATKPAWCDAPGKAQITVTSKEPGTFDVHAYLDAAGQLEVSASPKQLQFGAGEPDPSRSGRTVTPSTDSADDPQGEVSVSANGSDQYTVDVTVRSSAGILVDGATVRLAPVGDATGLTVLPGVGTVSTGTPLAPVWGHFTWRATSTVRSTYTAWVEVWVLGAWARIGDPVTLRFSGDVPDPSASWLVQPSPALANGTSQAVVRAQLRDANQNVAEAGTVVFHVPSGLTATAGGLTVVGGPGATIEVPVAMGVAQIGVTTTLKGVYTVTAGIKGNPEAQINLVRNGDAANSTQVDDQGRVRVTFVSDALDEGNSALSITTAGDTKLVGGQDKHQAQVVLRDANSNPVASTQVTFQLARGTAAGPTEAYQTVVTDVTSDANGVATHDFGSLLDAEGNHQAGWVWVKALALGANGPTDWRAIGQRIEGGVVVAPQHERGARFSPGPIDPSKLVFETWTPAVLNNMTDQSWARVVVRDSESQGIGGVDVTFTLPTTQPDTAGTPVFVGGSTPPTAKTVTVTTCDYDLDPVPARCEVNGVYTPGLAYVAIVSDHEGTFPVTGTIDGGAAGTIQAGEGPVTFDAGVASAAASWFEVERTDAAAAVVRANNVDSYTLTVTVMNGETGASLKPVAGECVTPVLPANMTVKNGPATQPGVCPPGSYISGVDGTVALEIVTTVAGTHNVGASLGGSRIATQPHGSAVTLPTRFVGGEPSSVTSELTSPPGPIRADDANGLTVVASVRDEFGNIASCWSGAVQVPCLVDFWVAENTWAGTGAARVNGPGWFQAETVMPDYDTAVQAPNAGTARASYRGVEGSYEVKARVNGQDITIADGIPAPAGTPGLVGLVFTDSTAPSEPTTNPSNGQHVAGAVDPSDEADAQNGELEVVVMDPVTDAEVNRCPVRVDGTFDCPIVPALPDGAEVVVVIVDQAGNVSDERTVVVDATPPQVLGPAPSEGETLTGVGDEVGDKIIVKDESGTVICETVVNPGLTWECALTPAQEVGDLVTIIEQDSAGNQTTKPWRIGVPEVTVALPSLCNGEEQIVTGINFQPGEEVTIAPSDELAVSTQIADADGTVVFRWEIPPTSPQSGYVITLSGPMSGSYQAEYTVYCTPPLPLTGADGVGERLAIALSLLAGGFLLVLATRRRKKAADRAA